MPRTTTDAVTDVHLMLAQLLYASPLPLAGDKPLPAPEQVRTHVRTSLEKLGHPACQKQIVGEFGDWPEQAVPRMRTAMNAIAASYPVHMLTHVLFTRRELPRQLLAPSSYVPVDQRPAAWSEMARSLADSGMSTAQIAHAIAVDEPTAQRLLALGGGRAEA